MASIEHKAEGRGVEMVAARDVENAGRTLGVFDNETVSTIVRFHRKERLGFLEEALFSLAIQSWRDHETIIAIQNGTDELAADVRELIARQPWPSAPRYKILNIEIPQGMDGRSTLLTRGIVEACGRYLAFLDDDDLIYQHGYATLVRQLKASGAALAVGGCRTAKVQNVSGSWFVQSKEMPFAWGRTRADLLRDNFIPIHSYVIDRTRVDARDLYFDDALPPLEDYDFLLRLCTKYEFDFSQLDTLVCEYRIHGLNSIPYDQNAPPETRTTYMRARQLIDERKKNLTCTLPVGELLDLQHKIIEKEAQLHEKAVECEQLKLLLHQHRLELQQRFLLRLAYKIYALFGRYPRLENRLSRLTHAVWGKYKKLKS